MSWQKNRAVDMIKNIQECSAKTQPGKWMSSSCYITTKYFLSVFS